VEDAEVEAVSEEAALAVELLTLVLQRALQLGGSGSRYE